MRTRIDAAVVLSGALALGIGGLSAGGYALGIAALARPFPDVVPMVLSTALALLIAGTAVVVEGAGATSRRLLLALGALIAAIGALAVLEWITGAAFGIDFPSVHRT